MNKKSNVCPHCSMSIIGGVAPAMKLSNNRILHYFGDTIEITDANFKVKEIFKRVGRIANESD